MNEHYPADAFFIVPVEKTLLNKLLGPTRVSDPL
jgi:hypothetical protein